MVIATWCTLAATANASRPDAASPEQTQARSILDATGVTGGLVVHLGCGDGKMTAALLAGDAYLVHGLDTDPTNVAKARRWIESQGLTGRVSVDRFDGKQLPYVDNLVNLVVLETGDVPAEEIMRVLCPGGAVTTLKGDRWISTVKPRPKGIDEWTHYLHDATNNAVANDTVIGPPRHLQWVGSPPWARHHDHMASTSALVSAAGRIFYIFDEGPTSAIQLPAKWSLIARDAFNGTILWKRPIERWHMHLWLLKSGPALLPRRLVAKDDVVYATLGINAPLVALDAATGKTIRTYTGTKATEEVMFSDGVLFLVVNERPTAKPWSTRPTHANIHELRAEANAWSWRAPPRSIMAIDAETGKPLWKKESAASPMTLTIDKTRVFFHDGAKIVCLDRKSGEGLWASAAVKQASPMRSWFAPTLVVHDDVVLFAGGEKMVRHRGGKDSMTALSAETGKVLWSAEHPPSGYDSPEDVFVIDGLVWTAPMTNRADTGLFTGRDLKTGEIKKRFPADDGGHMPHHRCHRAKATVNYILASRTGIEYVDLTAKHWNRNDWVRGSCLYGIMPANGLTYAPTHSCACYIVAKLNGFNVLAPARRTKDEVLRTKGETRLVKGPALDKIKLSPSSLVLRTSDEWPTYRCDAARSGRTTTPVPAEVTQTWKMEIGGRLSAVVVADGKVFVASVDRHTVHALDAASGRKLWSYTAGGRVDSPPTVWQGRVLFGSADGHVYCLRADDGALAWRFRAAPSDQRLTAFEQVESVWPVHGSVLVRNGVVHCVAGRSMFLDGGMRLLRLDAKTGKMLSQTVLDNRHPATGKPLDAGIKWPNLPVALPDVLSCDGRNIYMRSQRFTLNGRRPQVVAPTDVADQTGAGAHLFCPTGFLDDAWWHRTYWIWGKTPLSAAGGWYRAAYNAPAGRIMVVDDKKVYAFGRKPQYFPRTTALEYHLFCANKEPAFVPVAPKPAAAKKPVAAGAAKKQPPKPRRRRPPARKPVVQWSHEIPLLGRALVLAGDTLFVAGPPDVVDTEITQMRLSDPTTHEKLAEQVAAIAGQRGAHLWAVSAADGKRLATQKLDSPPVFDGMSAAAGRLYVATMDGTVVCFGK